MATPTDVARKLLKSSLRVARKVTDAPTGIEPGFDPETGIAWTEDGRARYRTNGNRALALYQYASGGGQNIGHSTTILDFDDPIYDPQGLVTTGASWIFTAPYSGFYQVICGLYLTTQAGWGTGFNSAARLRAVFDNTSGAASPPFASGTMQLDLQYPRDGDNNIQVFLHGTVIGYMNAGDTMWTTAAQDSLTTTLATSVSSTPGISILRV